MLILKQHGLFLEPYSSKQTLYPCEVYLYLVRIYMWLLEHTKNTRYLFFDVFTKCGAISIIKK